MWRKIGSFFVVFCVLLLILQLNIKIFQKQKAYVGDFTQVPTIIIDAGHGGEDGGAVALSGAIESEINLQIALTLEQLLLFYGIEPILLREEDISLHQESAITLKEKKSSDLKERVALVNGYKNGFLISIHQNSYTEPEYHGAQVFYTKGNEEFGRHLQELLRVGLDPDNQRVSKQVESSIYLMNHIDVSGVLVECGFLSNPQEAARLTTESYQKSIACVITVSLLLQNKEFT